MRVTDSLLVSVTYEPATKTDSAVLVVGKKTKGESITIINAFQGEEAIDIWNRLTEVKKGLDE